MFGFFTCTLLSLTPSQAPLAQSTPDHALPASNQESRSNHQTAPDQLLAKSDPTQAVPNQLLANSSRADLPRVPNSGLASQAPPILALLEQVGLRVESSGKMSRIVVVLPNSEASRAGLRIGDQVVSASVEKSALSLTLKRNRLRFTQSLHLDHEQLTSDDEIGGEAPGHSSSTQRAQSARTATDKTTDELSPSPFELKAETIDTIEQAHRRLAGPGAGRTTAESPAPFPLSTTINASGSGLIDPQAFQKDTAQPDSAQKPPFDLHAQQNGIPNLNVPPQNIPMLNAPMEVRILADYNIELIVDRSMSMRHRDCPGGLSRWEWCGRQAQDLSNAIAPYLPNGLTIVPFGGTFEVYPQSSPQGVANLFRYGSLQFGTRLCEPLTARLNSYFAARNQYTKPLLIAVITDGIPFPPPEPDMVRDQLIRASGMMNNARDVTVVFFQIGGRDRFGHDYLHSLDTDLVRQGARFHYVHMIPFERLEQIGLAQALAQVVSQHESKGWRLW